MQRLLNKERRVSADSRENEALCAVKKDKAWNLRFRYRSSMHSKLERLHDQQ